MVRFHLVIFSSGILMATHLLWAAEAHITLDTTGGNPGDLITIRAGYLSSESGIAIDEQRRLVDGAESFVTILQSAVTGGMFDGWVGGQADPNPTADFFSSTGRLDGGHFHYEIAEVIILEGDTDAVFAIENTHQGVLGISDGATQVNRSYDIGPDGHYHGSTIYLSHSGIYDVTFRAWDANGKYATDLAGGISDVVVRFIGSGLGDFNTDGLINAIDIDTMRGAIDLGLNDAAFDLDGEGGDIPDVDDFDFLITQVIGTGRGDGNLDFSVNFDDFVLLTNSFGDSNTGWNQGNYNLDSQTNFDDFVIVSNNFGRGFSSVSDVAVVPEASVGMLIWMLIMLSPLKPPRLGRLFFDEALAQEFNRFFKPLGRAHH